MLAGRKGPCARIHRNHSMAAPPGWAARDRGVRRCVDNGETAATTVGLRWARDFWDAGSGQIEKLCRLCRLWRAWARRPGDRTGIKVCRQLGEGASGGWAKGVWQPPARLSHLLRWRARWRRDRRQGRHSRDYLRRTRQTITNCLVVVLASPPHDFAISVDGSSVIEV